MASPVISNDTLLIHFCGQWWPGGLGKVSTHAIVYAHLILDGQDHGVHGIFSISELVDSVVIVIPLIKLGS